MDKIKKYIDSFFKGKEINCRYSMSQTEVFTINNALKKKRFETIVNTFEYGYAKGYRAAMAEMGRK